MTDEAKALVERLRLKSRDTRETSPATCDDAANLIEAQAREIKRLRGLVQYYLEGSRDW